MPAEPATRAHHAASQAAAGAGPLLLAALAYAAAGWPVLPVHTPQGGGCSCGHQDCTSPGKHPRLQRGLLDASTCAPVIAGWWKRWPDANVAVRTDELVVIDVDGAEGAHALRVLEAAHRPLPATRRARTGSGEHLYFHPATQVINCSAARLGPGLDVRGRSGYIIAPPSRHISGHRYAWTDTHEIAVLPEWLAELLSGPADVPERSPLPTVVARAAGERAHRYLQAALDGELTELARAPVGTRNQTLNRAAFRLGQLAGAGLADPDELANALLAAALAAGLGEREARATLASGLRAGTAHPRPLPDAT